MKIAICGCTGKMGKWVIQAAKNHKGFEIAYGVDTNTVSNTNFPVFSNPQEINVDSDVIIDFSHPSVLASLLEYAQKTNTPAVICTTGLSENQVNEIKKASQNVPIFYSRNMSLGINILLELTRKTAQFLGTDFDIEIIEKHHNQKIDAPSGTALMIAEEITDAMVNKPEYTYDRTQRRIPRNKNELGIHCVRGGSIAGDHEVIFAGNNETITLAHHAQSREIFANGALKASEFLVKQKPGLYTMKHIIKNI